MGVYIFNNRKPTPRYDLTEKLYIIVLLFDSEVSKQAPVGELIQMRIADKIKFLAS